VSGAHFVLPQLLHAAIRASCSGVHLFALISAVLCCRREVASVHLRPRALLRLGSGAALFADGHPQCMVLDFLPDRPTDPSTALALASGGSVPGACVSHRRIS
jgi:hypothetical protein